MTTQIILSGTTASYVTVSAGEQLQVQSGGVVWTAAVQSGGVLYLSSGGWEEYSLTVESGGEVLGPGELYAVAVAHIYGTISGVQLGGDNWADAEVDSGGVADDVTVRWGQIGITSGAVGSGLVIQPQGYAATIVVSGVDGVDIDATIHGVGGVSIVEAGGITYNDRVSDQGTDQVWDGGVASHAIIDSGGMLIVNAGGAAVAPVLNASGSASVGAGGVISSAQVNSGGTVTVSSGGVDIADVINSGGVEIVVSGAIASQTVVGSGGTEILEAGAIASGVVVSNGGLVELGTNVSSGQTMTAGPVASTTVEGGLTILAGGQTGLANGAVVMSGGVLSYTGGRIVSGLNVQSGGRVIGPVEFVGSSMMSGSVSGASIGDSTSSGMLQLWPWASANGVIVTGGELLVDAFAVANNTVLMPTTTYLNEADVYGAANGTSVGSGAMQFVESNGRASGTVLSFGGVQIVGTGGGSVSATVVSSGGFQIDEAGVDSGTIVSSGGNEVLLSGAIVSGVTVSAGGAVYFEQLVSAGQHYQARAVTGQTVVSGVTLKTGAYEDVIAGVDSGGILTLGAGAASFGLAVVAGGVVSGPGTVLGPINGVAGLITGVTVGEAAYYSDVVIEAGGSASGVTVVNGLMVVQASATAVGAQVDSGSMLTVSSGGLASGGQVNSGGMLGVLGAAVGATIENGGSAWVEYTGVVSATLVGGVVAVLSGGHLYGETVGSGGTEWIGVGGSASGTQVDSGGAVVVLSGGSATNITVSSGGTYGYQVVVSGGQSISAPTRVVSGATVMGGVTLLSGAQEGFADAVVLSGGTLSVSSGQRVYSPLISAGGTLLGPGEVYGSTYVAGAVSGVTFGEAASGGILEVQSGGTASGVGVRNGDLLIDSGAAALGGVISGGGSATVLSHGSASGLVVDSGGLLLLNQGAAITSLGVQSGAIIDLLAVAANSASVNSSGQLVATSGGVVVDTIGLAAGAGGYSFSTRSDGAGGTEILVGSNSAPPVANDFLGLGSSDILWRNTANGEVDVWLSTPGSAAVFTGQGITDVPTNWTIEATGDFTGGGLDDLLWRNTSNGEVDVWTTSNNGSSVSFAGQGLSVVPLDWQLQQSTADFTGDGLDDLAWRNTTTGELDLWLTNPGSPLTFTEQGLAVVPTAFAIQSFADFNGDGKADILWRNTSTGELDIWTSNPGSTVSFTGQGIGIVPLNETIVGVGDFTGDGRADVLWLNTTTGELDVWLTNPVAPGSPVTFTEQGLSVIPSTMSVAQVGDFTGDGRADILWRNSGNGDAYLWLSNPGSTVSFTGQDLGVVPASFQIVSDWRGA
jgi:autotransporter passenger strand-loop-strand repeat protein